jgi:alkyldihydroxyacetonephosphate synthase
VARDLWPIGTLQAWQGVTDSGPDRVWWPETAAQIAEVLKAASAQGIPLVPLGAGSGVCGGAAASAGSWTVDLKRMAHIGPLDEERWTVDVEAGVNGQQLEDWLAARGFTLGHSPSSIACSTVGGWAAARSAGQFSSRYGVFEDMVLRLEGVAPGIGAFAVGEGGDQPDGLLEQLLGSEGTLAVLTKLRLRVHRSPEARLFTAWRYDGMAPAVDAMRRLMQGELWPSVVRLYDPVDTWIGGRTQPKAHMRAEAGFFRRWLAAVDAIPAIRRHTLALPLALPGLVNRLAGRLAGGVLLIVGFEGDAAVARAQLDAALPILSAGGADLGSEPGERWLHSRHHVSYKLMPVFERGGFADTMEVATTWSGMVPLYEAVRAAVAPTAIVMAHISHVYPEGGCIYFSFAGRGREAAYRRTWEAALQAVAASGATVSHHHGIGQLKATSASREIGPALAFWKGAKATLDPPGIMNPGRLYSGTTIGAPPPPPPVQDVDHLGPAGGDDALWDWERVTASTRAARLAWQTTAVAVQGTVDGRAVWLGRGPRSAAGIDARRALLEADPDATTLVALAPPGPRWMGSVASTRPWRLLRDVLRADFRPGSWGVHGGHLFVGFRGPSAPALGALLAARWNFAEVPWRRFRLASGPLVPCDIDHKGAVTATLQGAFRRSR